MRWAVLKRLKFVARSEAVSAELKRPLEKTIDAALAALEAELEQVRPDDRSKGARQQPKREKVSGNPSCRQMLYGPEASTTCALARIGKDLAGNLANSVGVLTAERHVRDELMSTQPASRVEELVPHRWQPTINAS